MRQRQVCFLMICLLAGGVIARSDSTAPQTDPGVVQGQVRFTGDVPKPKRITTTDGGTLEHSDLVVDPKTKGLRHVVAILEDAPAQPKLEKTRALLVDQRDMVFLPRVVAVQHGQAVRFENNDLCNHSVMAASTVKANQFNVFVTGTQPYEHVFDSQKHPVQIGCSLHGWMRAWVYVMPHPWFAVTNAEGQFRIERVPPGKYALWLRHADTGQQERRAVEVQAGRTTEVKFEWKTGE